jgi:hypothetical protein
MFDHPILTLSFDAGRLLRSVDLKQSKGCGGQLYRLGGCPKPRAGAAYCKKPGPATWRMIWAEAARQ